MTAKYAHLAMSSAVLSKSIKDIATKGKAFDALVHKTGVACLIEALTEEQGGHLNANAALNMVKALPPGASRGRVVAWIVAFSNIRITAAKDDKNNMVFTCRLVKPGADDFKDNAADLVLKANTTPFYQFEQDRNLAPFIFGDDFLARAITNIVRRYDKAVEEGNVDPAMPAADIAAIEAMRKMGEAVTRRAEGLKAQRAKAAQAADVAKAHTPNPSPTVRKRESAARRDAARDQQQMASA